MFLRRSLLAALFLFATAAFADSIILVGTAPGAPTIEVSVELNPQPLPPGGSPATTLDLFDPKNPKLVNPGTTPGWAMGIGIVEIPRVGQEVLVNFLEGDPDTPIVVGSHWNAIDAAGNHFQVLWTDFPEVAPGSWNPLLTPGHVGATFQVCLTCDPVMGFEVVSLDAAGNSTTYTFQQVPEPDALTLLAGGCLMATGWRRRR